MDLIKLNNGFNLHFLRTDKFKTLSIVFLLRDTLDRDTVTRNALIPLVLKRGCNKYPGYEELTKAVEEIYGALFDANIIKKGNEHILQFFLETLSGESMLEDGIAFLSEIILNPLVTNNSLNERYIDLEKENLRLTIRNKINNKQEYANFRCIEEMFSDDAFGIDGMGYEHDIDNIDGVNLYERYKYLLNHAPVDILIIGNISSEKLIGTIKKFFGELINREQIIFSPAVNIKEPPLDIRIIKENDVINQGKLCIGLTTDMNSKGREYYPALLLNSILGGNTNSKLFQVVREKEGLCYYVSSILYRFKMFILITAGIESCNYEKSINLIKELIDEIKSANITPKEIDAAKKSIKKQFETIKDIPGGLMDFYMSQYMLSDESSVLEMQHNVDAVTKDDLVKAAQSLQIDTIYFLSSEGEALC